jgi:hypothetical protein
MRIIGTIFLSFFILVVTGQNSSGFYYKGDTLFWVNKSGVHVQVNNQPLKTINSTSLLGSGNINISGAGNPAWVDITGKPTVFAPATHQHIAIDITDLTKTSVGLSNVDNTSDANKPISTSVQTSLNGKQNTITTGTTSQYLKGDLSLGSYAGYSIPVQALTSSPTDAQTVYFGMLPKAPVTAAATSKIYIRQSGTIKRIEIYCYSGTAGTSEAWALYARVNNTTDNLIATLSVATNERIFSNTNLNIVVSAGDYIEIKGVQPTWATNPLTTIYGGYIYIE